MANAIRSDLTRITTIESRELITKYVLDTNLIFRGHFTYILTTMYTTMNRHCAIFITNNERKYANITLINDTPMYIDMYKNEMPSILDELYNNLLIREQPIINALMYVNYIDLLPELISYIKKYIV